MGDKNSKREFVELLVEHQPRIYAYIRTLVPDRESAEDIYQSTCVVLWEKFDSYEPQTSFGAWAVKIAYYEILARQRDFSRDRLCFDTEALERMAVEVQGDLDGLSDLREALQQCLAQLSQHQRQLLEERYRPDASVSEMARRHGRPVQTIYTILKRSRVQLLQCMQQRLRLTEDR